MCRPSLALSVASDRQSTVSLGTSYGPGLSRMSFKPRGPGAGEMQPCGRVYHQAPAPLGQAFVVPKVPAASRKFCMMTGAQHLPGI